LTGDERPYNVVEITNGQRSSNVSIGIKNVGGRTLSNCKVYITKISPPTGAAGGDVLLLKEDITLRHDDSAHNVQIAAHWDNTDKFTFSLPHHGGFFDGARMLDGSVKRTIEIRVRATECERSALFEIWADESRRLHLKLLNYIN
jgi:hypothetical protein